MKFNKWTLGLAAIGVAGMASAVRSITAKERELAECMKFPAVRPVATGYHPPATSTPLETAAILYSDALLSDPCRYKYSAPPSGPWPPPPRRSKGDNSARLVLKKHRWSR